jgi:hypothetical protein
LAKPPTIEFPHFGIKQIIEKQGDPFRPVPGSGLRIKTAPPLGFPARHKGPADVFGVFANAGLDGFVLAGLHLEIIQP